MNWPPREMHFSHLKILGTKSPAHYRQAVRDPKPPSPAMRMGTIVHALVLGGHFRIWEGDRRRAGWKAYAKEHAGERIFTRPEVDKATPIVEAIQNHPIAGPLIASAWKREARLTWETLGMQCAGTLDLVGDGWIADLKGSFTSDPQRFPWQARRMHYHTQLAWYRSGARDNDLDVERVYSIAVEFDAPHAVTVFRLTEGTLELGDRSWRLWLERLKGLRAADVWPEYATEIVELDLEEHVTTLDFTGVEDDDEGGQDDDG